MAVEIPVVIDIDKAFLEAAKRVGANMHQIENAVEANNIDLFPNIEESIKKLDVAKHHVERLVTELKGLMTRNEAKFFAPDDKEIAGLQKLEEELIRLQVLLHQPSGFDVYISDLPRANIELLQMREYYKELEESSMRLSTSLNGYSARLKSLNDQWANLTAAQKFNADGSMTTEAKALYNEFRKETLELQKQGQTLNDLLAKEQRRIQLSQQFVQKQKYENAILNSTATTMRALQEQERILSGRLSNTQIGSEKYKKYKAQLQEVRKELEKINKELNDTSSSINTTNSQLNGTNSRLISLIKNSARLIALHSATRFIRNVREVTSEFELQRVALGGIIQDTERANVLFRQIKAAAIESPFEIKDLVSYTKQLSAYRIETDKLFDVTQQLADVSSGLGVDMGRLILAYGQVRAASVLRGQELRQFTEAGVPLVELLADKFTKLNGQMVSTADVFELISKRAVPFEMIAEIFDDMTNKGGMFYKMQEKQAETLLGQWNNLKDAVSIMYDEIGNTSVVHRAMESLISGARSLMLNWRQVGAIIKSLVASFALLKVASMFVRKLAVDATLAEKSTIALAKAKAMEAAAGTKANVVRQASIASLKTYSKWMGKASVAQTVFGRGLKSMAANFLGGGWITLAITAVSALTAWFISARKEANRLEKELEKIGDEGSVSINRSVVNFQKLAQTAVAAADGSNEQNNALKELERTYGDLIPSQNLQIDKLRELKGDYSSLTAAIEEKINMQIREQKINAATDYYSGKISKARKNAKKLLQVYGLDKEQINAVLDEVQESINNGLIDINADLATNKIAFQNIIKDLTGIIVDLGYGFEDYEGTWHKVTEFTNNQALKALIKVGKAYDDLDDEVKDIERDMSSSIGSMGVYAKAWEDLQKEIKDVTVSEKEFGDEYSFGYKKEKIRKEVELLSKAIEDAFKDTGIDISGAFDPKGTINFKPIADAAKSSNRWGLPGYIQNIQKAYESLVPTNKMIGVIERKFEELASAVGVSMDDVQGYLLRGDKDMSEYKKEIDSDLEAASIKLIDFKKQIEDAAKHPDVAPPVSDEDYTKAVKLQEFLSSLSEYLSDYEKEKKKAAKKDRSALAFLKEDLKNVQEIYKRYQEFLKYMDKSAAQKKIKEIYGGVTAVDFLEPDTYKKRLNEILQQIRQLQGTVRKYNKELSTEMFNDIKETLKKNEGLRLEAYKLPGEKEYTIGYGFYKNLPDGRKITAGMKITEEEAEKYLDMYVKSYSDTTNKLLSEYGKGIELTERQFNVLVDLTYQGPAALKKALIKANGDIDALAEALKDAASTLVAPQMRDAVKKRDMKRYAAFLAGGEMTDEEAKEVAETIFDTERIVQDVDWDEFKEALSDRLQKLSDEMKRAETARNFYENILDLTGDEDLAASMTMSVYGGVGKDFKERMQEQLNEALGSLDWGAMDDATFGNLSFATITQDFKTILEYIDLFPEEWQKVIKQMASDNEKNNADWYTDFIKTFRKAKTYEERINTLQQQKQQKMAEASERGMSQSDKDAVAAYYDKEIAGVQLEAMKDTYTWTKAFEDLESVSGQTLENLIALIDEYVDKNAKDLEPQQLKELSRSRENAKQQLLSRQAYKATGDAVKDLISASKRYTDIQAEGKGETEEGAQAADDLRDAIKRLGDALSNIYSHMDDVVSKTKELMSVFASDEDASYFGEQLDNISKTVQGAGSAAMGMAQILSGAITPQAIMQTVSGLADVVSGIFGGVNAKQVRDANKEFDKQAKLLQKLERSYNQLEQSIGEAFGNESVTRFTEQLQVLQAQYDAYLAQAANREEAAQKESTKKNRQRYAEEAEEAKSQAMDVQNTIANLRYEASSKFAGSDLSAAAESFADAWLSAYQEFGDTSTAIEERMTEMVQNIVKKAALSGIAQSVLGNWYDSLADVTDWNAQTIAEKWKEAMALVNPMVEGMQVFANSMQAEGVSLRNTVGQFTGISRDIAGASEESINGLAAGINTQNFYMSFMPLIHENVAQILTYMTGGNTVTPATETGIEAMPSVQKLVYDHLPNIDANISSVLQLLRSVISVGQTAPRNYVAIK